jgi:hypothetical protein
MGLLKVVELSLYRQIAMPTKTFSPFNWWAEHEQQFPSRSFVSVFVFKEYGFVGHATCVYI